MSLDVGYISSDDIDLEELDRLEKLATQRKFVKKTDVTDDLKRNLDKVIGEKNELTKKVQSLSGENAILRSNLSKKNVEHVKSVESFIASQTKSKDDYLKQIEDLKREVDKLRTEKLFLSNEVQDVSMMMKIGKRRVGGGGGGGGGGGSGGGGGGDGSPNNSPSPSKRRSKRDLEASFKDGFDNPMNTPSKRRRRQEVIRQMGNNKVIGSSKIDGGRMMEEDGWGIRESDSQDGVDFPMIDINDENYRSSPNSAMNSPKRFINRSTITSPVKGFTTHSEIQQPELIPPEQFHPNLTCDYIKSNCNIEFYRLITSHILPNSQLNTLQLLSEVEYGYKTNKPNTIASFLLESFFDPYTSDIVDFITRCLEILSTIEQNTPPQLSILQSYPLILYLLEIAYTFDPIRIVIEHATLLDNTIQLLMTLTKLGLPEIQKISKLPSTDEIPWFKTISLSTESSIKVSILLCSLDVLETITICCSLDPTSYKKCWSLINIDFLKDILLSPNQYGVSINILIKSTRILMSSISDTLLGPTPDNTLPIETKAKLQLEQESLILNTLIRYLFQKFDPSLMLLFTGLEIDDLTHQYNHQPISPTYIQSSYQHKDLDINRKNDKNISYELYIINDQQLTLLHQLIIQFFTTIALRRNINLLIEKCNLLPELAQVISHQLDIIYDTPEESKINGRVQFINNSIRLFHFIWSLHEDSTILTRSLFGESGYENVIAMARIALSEYPDATNPSVAVRFEPDVIERARDILEQCMTLAEADEIYLSMHAT